MVSQWMATLVRSVKLPSVTGYILAGLVIGPYGLGLLSVSAVSSLSFIETIALGFVAFSLGKELKVEQLRTLGASVIWLTLAQALATASLVVVGLFALLNQPLPIALLLGGIAVATAAATLMVIRECRARGPLTDALIEVVALDDVLGIMIFGVLLSVARLLFNGQAVQVSEALVAPISEIALSILVGVVLGFLLARWVGSKPTPFRLAPQHGYGSKFCQLFRPRF